MSRTVYRIVFRSGVVRGVRDRDTMARDDGHDDGLGTSGSTAAAPSPTSSGGGRTARSSRTSSCRKIPKPIATPPWQGIRDLLGLRSGEPIPPGRDRRGEDGHHRRHQRAARAQGRAHAPAHHQGLPRRAARSATRRGRRSSRATSSSRTCSTSASSKSTSACAPTARSSGRPTSPPCARRSNARAPTASQAVAIVFMHAYRYPEHERRVAALARELGFAQVSVSHEVSPLIKLVGARRHHRGRRLSLADPAPLRGAGGGGVEHGR